VREIVKAAVSQVVSELKEGSYEIRTVVKDAISAVISGLRESGSDVKEGITASIEGAIEGVSHSRRQAVSEGQAELKRLQTLLDAEEDELEQQVEASLVGVEEAGQEAPSELKAHIEAAINTLKNSEEADLLKKRYAQLQAQAAILKANLAARYGGRYEEIQEHLDEATTWVSQTRSKAEVVADQAEQKRSQLEERIGEAGTAVAKRERKVRKILSDLLHTVGDALQEKEPVNRSAKPTELEASKPKTEDLSDL
jgi:flagellar hook-basal body complex protein FliE